MIEKNKWKKLIGREIKRVQGKQYEKWDFRKLKYQAEHVVNFDFFFFCSFSFCLIFCIPTIEYQKFMDKVCCVCSWKSGNKIETIGQRANQ